MPNIQTLSDIVEGMLRSYPHLRDDDNRLTASIWKYEMSMNKGITDFLTAYAYKQITMADTITRVRRKLQEMNPDLRGTTWQERHHKEQKVITDLKSIKRA